MPQRIYNVLKTWGIIIGIVTSIFGAIQAYSVLPYKVEELKRKTEFMESKAANDHDILTRIYQDVQYLKMQIDKQNK